MMIFIRGQGYIIDQKVAYLSSLMLHMISSFQLTKIMATSFSVNTSDSSRGFWKVWKTQSLKYLVVVQNYTFNVKKSFITKFAI